MIMDHQQATLTSTLSLFDEQVRYAPDAVALREDARTVCYRELAERVQVASNALLVKGVEPGNHIVLFMPRSIEFVVAALATLRVGAAYVPVDPNSPIQRSRTIMARCAPALVLTAGSTALPGIDWPALSLQELCEEQSQAPAQFQALGTGDEIAYVLHTSGTTGEPNGVQITNRGLVNYLTWAARSYATEGAYDAIWHTATTFDLSITSFLVPLIAGGCVDIVPGDSALEKLLHRLFDAAQPVVVKVTPTHVRAIIDWFDAQQHVREVAHVFVIGGEELLVRDCVALQRIFPNCRIYNEYGPTEATVGCCVQAWGGATAANLESVAIGTPIDGMALYVVNESGEQVPAGTRGELLIAGVGVMAGYLGNPELSAKKLLNVTWDDRLCYATGDMGALREDGVFLYFGRTDTQVKLNGYRIELTEIETQAMAVAQVSNAAAVVKREGGGSILALFVETQADPAQVEQSVAKHLGDALPDYMRPSRIMALPALPVTAHGKIDRRSLAELQVAQAQASAEFHTDSIEETLIAVWQRVLQRDVVTLDDNYFALGGDSLRSIEVTALAEQRGVRFTIATLHMHPTVRSLAKAVREATAPVDLPVSEPFYLVSEQDRARIPSDVEDAYPLNLLQEGMIYHREFAAKSAVYHAICSYHVEMPVDVDAMRDAVHELVARHPLLRTSFDLTHFSRPLQLVHKASEPEFGYLDLRHVDPQTHQDYVDSWLEDEKKRGFEIEQYPLIRFMLHHFSEGTCQLSYSFHHEIIDGWSDALMVTELVNRYMARVSGEVFELPELRSTFRDSILLEQLAVNDDSYREFWNERMRDVSVMRLPSFVPPRADLGQREIIKFEVPISGELSDAVKQLARELAVPLKSVLLAAHMKVMSLLGGVDDVMSYTVSNGRPENRDSHAVIGLFVNSLAFRMSLPGGSWRELILDTLHSEHEVLARRRYPMAEVKRQHGSEPLSETLFFFNHYHVTDELERWPNLKMLGLKVYAESTFPFCVNAFLTPFEKDLRIRLEYDNLRYDKAVMDVAGDFYLAVLTAMVKDPSADYHADAFLAREQLDRVLGVASGALKREQRPFLSVVAQIAEHARRTPEHIAVVSGESRITYAELDAMAARFAKHLVEEEHVRPADMVGVLMSRGLPAIVAMLGILKSGAAYVPLNVDQPAARLACAIKQTGSLVVCDDAAYAHLVPGLDSEIRFVRYSDVDADADIHDDVPVCAQSAAYVIFTSGSTGVPKATVVSHANLDSSTRERVAYYGLGGRDRCALLSSQAFDSAVGVIFGALVGGATLVIPDEETLLDLAGLVQYLRASQVTMTLCTPSLLDTLLATDDFITLKLRQIISAGEALSCDTYARAAAIPGATVYNEYGPTEATVWASVWQGQPYRPVSTMPIGRAIPSARLYVLDQRMHPVAVGVPGELYIGGEGVAQGYLGAPAQTAAVYLPDPFGDVPGARLYRTGDLVRLDLEGNIEFLSRRDRLVKVQGFRVEPGEIEHVLATHPQIHRAVAVVKAINGIKQLVAYIVRRDTAQALSVDQLKAFCKQNLPKYMLPAQFVFVDAVPVSSTGKVDLASLEHSASLAAADHSSAAPQSPLQAMLAGIWQTALNVERVGIHDDFMTLGGESLAALRIAAKVRSTLDVDIPVRTLLAAMDNIAMLAEALEAHSALQGSQKRHEELESGTL
ncbi:non-ribosomal peptide synthetase [Pseudomonas sp. RHF3.3-3]|uniref:Amino acid adenylation enzyme/thioester reductase family protein n=1 Tax=Pseudomonas asplenii TaxID=53407 RepID=A0A0M9GG36_9PSED|nr:non-ribosomal peptide synthetase [Pseudomonas fuscovaginae]KPA90327.1 amino acid adenylation enzyme/thioester reductase family protein [Pseudomonas fuscovaginae]